MRSFHIGRGAQKSPERVSAPRLRQRAVKIVDVFAVERLPSPPVRGAQIIECKVDSAIIRGVNELDTGQRGHTGGLTVAGVPVAIERSARLARGGARMGGR